MEEKIQKPFILEMEEAKLEIVQCINNIIQNKKIPCYLLSPIIENIYKDVQIGAQNELTMAKQQMEIEEEGSD